MGINYFAMYISYSFKVMQVAMGRHLKLKLYTESIIRDREFIHRMQIWPSGNVLFGHVFREINDIM